MKTFTKTTITEANRLVIEYDQDCDSPREWSNLGFFITQDRNYNSPDNHPDFMEIIKETADNATDCQNHMKRIKKEIEARLGDKVLAIYPMVKYEHSGVSYSRGEKHGFDYSNNGFYIITQKTAEELGTDKKDFEKVIDQEINIYNKWINGEVYRFTLYNEAGEFEDSCCGFYDIEDIRDSLPSEWKNEDLTQYLRD